jgi:hypothetical protein
MKAQGNALGKATVMIPSPERASQNPGIHLFCPFRANVVWLVKPRALPWAIMSLRFQRDKNAPAKPCLGPGLRAKAELNSEAIQFRVASECFAQVRKLTRREPE